jgi:hypothetical protein
MVSWTMASALGISWGNNQNYTKRAAWLVSIKLTIFTAKVVGIVV